MKKRKVYSENISAKDWINKNIEDIWSGIKELQRVIRVAIIITIAAVSLKNKRVQKLLKELVKKVNKTTK